MFKNTLTVSELIEAVWRRQARAMTKEELEKWIADGHLTWEQLAKCCLSFMSDKDVRTMASKMFVSYWGERCPDYDSDCPACMAWKNYDALARRTNP